MPTADLRTKQQEIMLLHSRLMTVYVYIIEAVSRTDRLPKGAEPSLRNQQNTGERNYQSELFLRYLRLYKRRPITRNLVYAHVKGKLNELRAVYAEIEQVASTTDRTTLSFRNWLRDTQDSLSRFSATLSVMDGVRRAMVALWPLIIALLALAPVWNYFLRLSDKKSPGGSSYTSAIILLIVFYVAIVAAISANKKRKLFLAFIKIPSRSDNSILSSISMSVTAANVYEVEDDLFDIIGRPKRRELALDPYALAAMFFAWFSYCLYILFGTDMNFTGRIVFVVQALLFAVICLSFVAIGRGRRVG